MNRFWLLFLVVLGSCSTPKKMTFRQLLDKDIEIGKCYFALQSDTFMRWNPHTSWKPDSFEFRPGFVLRFHEAKFQKERRIIVENDFRENSSIRVPVREFSTYFRLYNDELEYYHSGEWKAGLCICLPEISGTYKTVSKKDFEAGMTNYDFEKEIEAPKLEFIFVKKRPKKLAENELFYEEGYWMPFKELIGNSHNYYDFKTVELKLREHGFLVEINETYDEADKEAIKAFQKKTFDDKHYNDGQLNTRTLRALGVLPKSSKVKYLPKHSN